MPRALIALLLALPLLGTSDALAKPPSFQAWNDAWVAQEHVWQDRWGERCEKLYGGGNMSSHSPKVGHCFVTGMSRHLRHVRPAWERAMARIARNQSAPCRRAIRTYLLASRKSHPAVLAYLDPHPYIDVYRIVYDVFDIRATSDTDIPRWKADWVCGHATTIDSHDEAVIPPD
jgi:hypothetical protein